MRPTILCTGQAHCTEWYSQGESMAFHVGDAILLVRFVGRKGRRARISVSTSSAETQGFAGILATNDFETAPQLKNGGDGEASVSHKDVA